MAKKKKTKTKADVAAEKAVEIQLHLLECGCREQPNVKDCVLSEDGEGNIIRFNFRNPGVLSLERKSTKEEKADKLGNWIELNKASFDQVKLTEGGIEMGTKPDTSEKEK